MRFFPCVVKTQMLWLSFGINSKKSVTNIDKLGYSRCKDNLGIGLWKFFYEYYAFQQHMLSFSSNKSKLNEIPADTVVPSLFPPNYIKELTSWQSLFMKNVVHSLWTFLKRTLCDERDPISIVHCIVLHCSSFHREIIVVVIMLNTLLL